MAEAMLRQRLEARGVSARIHSAGLLLDLEPAHPYAIDTLSPSGLDLTAHRSCIISSDILEPADLIIGMEQRHIREVLVVEPDAFSRAYTLPELVQRAEAVGPRTTPDFAAWLAEVGAGRKRLDLLRKDRALEVPDPIGGSKRQFRRTAEVLSALLDRLVELAWPVPAPSGHHGLSSEPPTSTPTLTPRST